MIANPITADSGLHKRGGGKMGPRTERRSTANRRQQWRLFARAAGVLLPAAILVAGCGPGDAGDHSGVAVTVDIYSGRENPEHALSGSVVEDLVDHIHSLTGSAESDGEHSGLGFRGFIIRGDLEGLDDADVSVVPEGVNIDHGDERLWMADGGVAFEMIFEDLEGSLSPEEEDAIRDFGR